MCVDASCVDVSMCVVGRPKTLEEEGLGKRLGQVVHFTCTTLTMDTCMTIQAERSRLSWSTMCPFPVAKPLVDAW